MSDQTDAVRVLRELEGRMRHESREDDGHQYDCVSARVVDKWADAIAAVLPVLEQQQAKLQRLVDATLEDHAESPSVNALADYLMKPLRAERIDTPHE